MDKYVCGACGWEKAVGRGRPPVTCPNAECKKETVSRISPDGTSISIVRLPGVATTVTVPEPVEVPVEVEDDGGDDEVLPCVAPITCWPAGRTADEAIEDEPDDDECEDADVDDDDLYDCFDDEAEVDEDSA